MLRTGGRWPAPLRAAVPEASPANGLSGNGFNGLGFDMMYV